jgi:spore maturation protein CgeB
VLVVHPGADFSVSDVHDGIVKGLVANGCVVGDLNLHDRLQFFTGAEMHIGKNRRLAFERNVGVHMAVDTICGDLYKMLPDVIVFTSGFFITEHLWKILARRTVHTVVWCTESPYEDDRQILMAGYADTVIVNDPTNIDAFRAVNPNTHYLPHSYDPAVHSPGPVDPVLVCDFAWVGTAFPSRIDFFRAVDWSGIDVKLAGNWQWLDRRTKLARHLIHPDWGGLPNSATVDLYRSCKMSANIYRKEATAAATNEGWSMGPREVELAACETFFLREPRGEGDELFPDAPTFDTPDEFGDMVRWWSAHDDEREKVARLNREAIADRTFTNTAAQLLRHISKET